MAQHIERDEHALITSPVSLPLVLVLAAGRVARRRTWQTLELTGLDFQIIDLGDWPAKGGGAPHRNTLVNRLGLAIHRARRPVLLLAHGHGCVVAAWWAEYENPTFHGGQSANRVLGAVLVEPPDLDRPGSDPAMALIGSCPRGPLPFPSFLVSDIAHAEDLRRSRRMLAADWGSRLAEVTRNERLALLSEHGPAPEARLIARLSRECTLTECDAAGMSASAASVDVKGPVWPFGASDGRAPALRNFA